MDLVSDWVKDLNRMTNPTPKHLRESASRKTLLRAGKSRIAVVPLKMPGGRLKTGSLDHWVYRSKPRSPLMR